MGITAGCDRPAPSVAPKAPATRVVQIEPGVDAAKRAQEALILAKPGDIVEFGVGTFEFKSTLSLDVNDVTIRGKGPEATILSFKEQGQGTGGEGILVTSKEKFTLHDLAIVDAKGDGIKVNGTNRVVFRNVHVGWSNGPKETNGGYGIYPVQSKNVLIESCHVSGAADSGIYVGQSTNIVIRGNTVEENVAGIEVENSTDADVYDNTATNNSGGVLVFTLPNLPKKDGTNCRVFRNKLAGNNHPNFAPKGNIVASVPPGTGMMIMANDRVEVFENTIEGNDTTGVSVVSFLVTQRPIKDEGYNPYCAGISIHSNQFANNGAKPQGSLATILMLVMGKPFPDILYDGLTDPKLSETDRANSLSVRENGSATFANFDAASIDPKNMLTGKKPKIVRDLKGYAGEIPSLPEVKLEGLN